MGRPKKLKNGKEVIIYAEHDRWKKLQERCLKKQISMSSFFREVIERFCDEEVTEINRIDVIREVIKPIKKAKKEKSTTTVKDLIYEQNWLDR